MLSKLKNFFVGTIIKNSLLVFLLLSFGIYFFSPYVLKDSFERLYVSNYIELFMLLVVYLVIISIINIVSYYYKKKLGVFRTDETLTHISVDDWIKISGVIIAIVYFLGQYVIGIFSSGLEINLACSVESLQANDIAVINVTLKKSDSSAIGIQDIFLLPEEISPIKENYKIGNQFPTIKRFRTLINDKFPIKPDSEKKIEFLIKPELEKIKEKFRLNSISDNMRLNPNDSVTLSGYYPVEKDKAYRFHVFVLGKTVFTLNLEEWASSCIVTHAPKETNQMHQRNQQ